VCGEVASKPRTELEKEEASKLKSETTAIRNKTGFIVNLVLIFCGLDMLAPSQSGEPTRGELI
jgi:hypothetical protein